jgi:flagellar M-ring protein FliF
VEFSWAGILKSMREFWGKLSRPQKVITVAAPLAVAIALFSLLYWASHPQYVAIFTKLSDVQAGAITTKLKDLKVDYQLADNGSSILVPQKQAPEVRLELANAGLPQGSKFSFDESVNAFKIGETEDDRRLRINLGLQNELETTLESLAGVQDARVHLVVPKESLFIDKQKTATAAVTLKLVPGTKIVDDQVRGIANLLSSSVEGLQSENVTIVDTGGNVLSDVLGKNNEPGRMTATQLQLKQTIEDDKQRKVQSMLDRVLGSGKTVVRANVSLNFDKVTTDTLTHGAGAIVSEAITTQTSTNGIGAGAPAGVNQNVPGYQNPVGTGTASNSESTSTTRNFEVDQTREQRIRNQGDIERLSVSVMLDADSVNQEQMNMIKTVVASAAGIVESRGDQIQVAALPFDKTGLMQQEREFEAAARKESLRSYIELGAGVLLALLFLFFVLRMRSKRKRENVPFGFGSELRPVPLAAAEELLFAQQEAEREAEYKLAQKKQKSAEEIQRQKVKEAVELYAKNNPDEVARLVKTWLAEER